MRRIVSIGAVAATALTAAAMAVANGGGKPSTKAVSATFAVTPSGTNKASTCKGADGDYTLIRGRYRGTSTSSDARLAGAISIDGDSVVNTTTGLGWMTGSLRIDSAGNHDLNASFNAVISGGQLTGFLNGRGHENDARLLGGLQAAFGQNGLTSGSIGSTSPTPALIVTGGCDRHNKHDGGDDDKDHKKKHDR